MPAPRLGRLAATRLGGTDWLNRDPAELLDELEAHCQPHPAVDLLRGRRPAWMAQAACAGMPTSTFYPSSGQPVSPALQVCGRCPVIVECRDWSTSSPDPLNGVGIAGGMTAAARRLARRARRDQGPT